MHPDEKQFRLRSLVAAVEGVATAGERTRPRSRTAVSRMPALQRDRHARRDSLRLLLGDIAGRVIRD